MFLPCLVSDFEDVSYHSCFVRPLLAAITYVFSGVKLYDENQRKVSRDHPHILHLPLDRDVEQLRQPNSLLLFK